MDLDIIRKIAEKTIGFDLEGVKASTPEESHQSPGLKNPRLG